MTGIDEFNPNAKGDPKMPVWASYIPSRSPAFKTHTLRSHAINALNNRASYGSPGIIYEYIDGEWVEWDRMEEPTHCAHCRSKLGGPNRYYNWRHMYNHPAQYAYKRPIVCIDCYEKHFGYGATDPKDVTEIGK